MIDASGAPRIPGGNVADPGPIVNDALNVNKWAEVYGEDPENTDPEAYDYLPGRWGGFSISAGSVALTDDTTNYIVVERSTGTLTVATTNTNWNNLDSYARVARIVLASGARTDVEDFRAGTGGVHGPAPATAAATQAIIIAVGDETTALTTGTNKVRFRLPYAFTLTEVRASVNTAPTGANLIVDINENGSTILSTKLSIDATETTSTTATTAAVISDSSLADDAEISINIDQVGSTIAGAGLKVSLIGVRT